MKIEPMLALTPKAWFLFTAGPLFLLLGIVFASAWLTVQKTPPDQIPLQVSAWAPHILLGTLTGLGILLLFHPTTVRQSWVLDGAGRACTDAAIGAAAGIALAFLYLHALAPGMEKLQRLVGDYVPPGSVLPTVSGSLTLFFMANVLLAPLVEETIYRGIALPLLETRFGPVLATILSCLLFGLLHWPGGLWYMAATAVAAGGLFAGLFLWRGNLMAPFAAHLALNVVEFLYVRARAS